MTETVAIMKGITLPFFPMRPANGRHLTKALIEEILDLQASAEHKYIFQPKLNGDRVVLGVANRQVVACNRHGGFYQYQIANAGLFLKLGNGTCLDGEVWKSDFYPFEALSWDGRSYTHNTTDEREIIAEQICHLLGVRWMYTHPTRKWLRELSAHLPVFEGVVRKRSAAAYRPLCSDSQTSGPWLKHRWA